MADERTRRRITARDWLADTQRRIRRLSSRSPRRIFRPRLLSTAGVLLHRQASIATRWLRLDRAIYRPQARLSLRTRPRLQAVRDPILTIQSRAHRETARPIATPHRPAQGMPSPVDRSAHEEPKRFPAPRTAIPILSTVSRAILRVLRRRQETRPSRTSGEGTVSTVGDPGEEPVPYATTAEHLDQEAEPAVGEQDGREEGEALQAGEISERDAGERLPPELQAGPEGNQVVHSEGPTVPPMLSPSGGPEERAQTPPVFGISN